MDGCVLMNVSSMNVDTGRELQLCLDLHIFIFRSIVQIVQTSTFISHLDLRLLESSRIFRPFLSRLHSIAGSRPLPHPATVAPSSGEIDPNLHGSPHGGVSIS